MLFVCLRLKTTGLPTELDKEVTDYGRFHRLNDLAAEICACTDAVLLDVGEFLETDSRGTS